MTDKFTTFDIIKNGAMPWKHTANITRQPGWPDDEITIYVKAQSHDEAELLALEILEQQYHIDPSECWNHTEPAPQVRLPD
jgi:hypothetical protein